MAKIAAFLALAVSFACAHNLHLFVYDEADGLHIKSYFTKSSPCRGCDILITGEGYNVSAKTDDEGAALITGAPQNITIRVDAGMGHAKEISHTMQHLSHTQATALAAPEDMPLTRLAVSLTIFALIIAASYGYRRLKRRR
jgi:hypothetical protein